jgi:protein-disulfide isomerase
MHDLLFENQSHLKAIHLTSYAERLRLDMVHYGADMKDHTYLQRIREHQQSGGKSGVRSTPTFFVNRVIQDVSFGLPRLFEAVEILLGSSQLPKRG